MTARGEWLLDLTVSGRVFRFATARVEVETAGGATVVYREGLRDLEESVALDGSADLSIGVSVDVFDAWESLVGGYLSVERSLVVLRRWFEGELLESARVVLSGQVDGFAHGDDSEPVSFAILRRVRTQSRQIPTPAMVADATTWPTCDDRIVGSHYPVVIGAPGTGAPGAPDPATEGLFVEPGASGKLMIAGHRVRASQVRVFDYSGSGAPVDDVLAVLHTQDGAGRTIAYVDMSGFSGTVDVGRNYYIGWDLADGGGYTSPISGGVLRGGGDIIEWMLRVFTDVKLDGGRFAAIRDRLNRYLFDTYFNSPADPLEWLSAEILSGLPVEPRQGEGGLYYYLRRLEATANDAIARLDADRHQVQRESAIETRSEAVVNEVTVQFGPNRQSGAYRSRIIVGPMGGRRSLDDEFELFDEDDPRCLGSYRAALSQAKYGRQPLSVELTSVWDRETAARHAQDILAAQALPRRFVTYSAQPEYEQRLDVGDIVILNDSSIRLEDQVAEIVDVVVGGAELELELELVDNPSLFRRA